jgi:hypothetical protein
MEKQSGNLKVLRTLIRDCLAESDGEQEAAHKKIMRKLKSDEMLFQSIIWTLVSSMVKRLMAEHTQHERFVSWNRAPTQDIKSLPSPEAKRELIEGAKLVAIDSLLSFPLRLGKPLGEAKKAEIESESEWYLKYAKSFGLRYRWFHLIAKALPDNKTKVKTVLDDKDLKRLQRRALSGPIKLGRLIGNDIRQIA